MNRNDLKSLMTDGTNSQRVALAEAIAEAYIGNYQTALLRLKKVAFPENTELHIEALQVSYVAMRGTGQSESAGKILQDFQSKTPLDSNFAAYRVHLANQIVTQFGDHDLGEQLIQQFSPLDERLKAALEDLYFKIAVYRRDVSGEEILQRLSAAKNFGPSEDWISALQIQRAESPHSLRQVIEVLTRLKQRAPNYGEAIHYRINCARKKIGSCDSR